MYIKKRLPHPAKRFLVITLASLLAAGAGQAQPATDSSRGVTSETADDLIVLSPFEVSADEETGYAAATTLAGNRLNTELRDIGNAVSVITSQFLKDINATSNETLLQYTIGTEVGNTFGNFAGTGDGTFLDERARLANPNSNTRVRGLTDAENTRDYFISDVPWDSYNIDRVDLQRGPNSILFGQSKPGGIINVGTKQARFTDSTSIELRYTGEGGHRGVLDINRVLLDDELAFRVIGLYNHDKFKQKPAYAIDKRIFGALRYEPKLLKRGSARSIFKGNFEAGEISSNRPRILPPIDRITPWFQTGSYAGRDAAGNPTTFQHLNRLTLNGSQAQDDNTSLPNHGQQRPRNNGGPLSGTPNAYYNPMLGNFGQQFGNPLGYVDGTSGSGAVSKYWTAEPRFARGIDNNGNIDATIRGMPYQRPLGIASHGTFATQAGLPFAEFGVYKNRSLTDPSVFDFYNNLYDGPNKREWRKFRIFNVSLAQTFFNDKAGFELTYNNEHDKVGQLSLLSGQNQAIYIDMMNVYADGTPLGTGTPNVSFDQVTQEPFQDGTPNPNLGRPFLNDIPAGNETISDRDNKRVTVFVTHDFDSEGSGGWLSRVAGKHTLTGLYAQDRSRSDARTWQRYSTDVLSLRNFLFGPNGRQLFNTSEFQPMPVIYLGPSLLNSSTASGAYIPRVQHEIKLQGGGLHTFDSTWNRPLDPNHPDYVNPAQLWHNNYYPLDQGPGNPPWTEADNPANYVGWRDIAGPVYDSENGYRNFNTTNATLRKDTLDSRAVTWQGHFWKNALVGTFGYREDSAKSWSYNRNPGSAGNTSDGRIDLTNSVYKLPGKYDNRIEVISRAYSIVGHLNEMPFLSDLMASWPVQVSVFYNKSTNFQPASQRVDVFGEALAAPEGRTIDKGILIESRDGRYSLKLNKYETSAVNASSNALTNAGYPGTIQAYGARWANRFEFNWTQDTNAGAVAVPDPTNTQYNYQQAPLPGGGTETMAQAQAREAAAVAAWRAWQQNVDPRFYAAWRLDITNPAVQPVANTPAGFAITEDSVSSGYEFEFNAMPTKNWRLTFNAAQTEAQRTNVGGAAMAEFVASFENALKNTAAGDLRIWWGNAGNDTTLRLWNQNIGSDWAQRRLQEGTNVPELREWRFNAVTNYDFDHGFLKGVNVGAGIRYQSDIVIGYPPAAGATPSDANFDLANPYRGPAETNFDFFVGYHRTLGRNIDWRIQLNVRNAFEGNKLIPINVQPDGSGAGFRIAPYQTWSLTNTFSF